MTIPPDMTRALVKARQRDLLVRAQRQQVAHAARAARRQRRAAEAALRTAPERRAAPARRWRRFRLAWLFGAQ
jgi:hypothetical protein